ncbi:peptidase C39 family protein [Streptomyces sp. NPDC012888]|uniref:peptidase C39 family protein n=1 Tax=Streptomyces sp. NPDC012888 TaxID=3364855 RepID=UPI00368DE171
MTAPAPRRALLAAALAAATAATAASVSGTAAEAAPAPQVPEGDGSPASLPEEDAQATAAAGPTVDNLFWFTYRDWRAGTHRGTAAVPGARPGLTLRTPQGRTEYADPHTGRRSTWEYASWTSPVHTSTVPATEAIASWNAHTPAGTWLQTEIRCTYTDGTATPWYVMGRWASGDADIRRTSVDGQTDGRSTVWTDTLAVDGPARARGLRLRDWRLRLTLYRRPGSAGAPLVWLAGAMASAVPDRFTVPASVPGRARELPVPRYSQEVHVGRYPEYDNGGEAWCSPSSSQMAIEYWGRRAGAEDVAWVDSRYTDPQVCHAARSTYDYAYKGCGNWPFNAAYAATYRGLGGVVTRLTSLNELETLVASGIPVITSQSFREGELTGAGYGTAGHLMTVVGFTASGDVVVNDPHAPTNRAVRRVYRRREFENVWLRTKRRNAAGKVLTGSGGVCYVFGPTRPTAAHLTALRTVGVL